MALQLEKSGWLHALNGGWQVAKDNLAFGIGTANYGLSPQNFLKNSIYQLATTPT